MKKFSAVLFLMALATTTICAASFRADVAGMQKEGKVKLTPGKAEGMKTGRQTWRGKEDQPFTVNASSAKALPAGQWTDCVINFTADESGTIRIELKGQWAKDVAQREWVKIGPITINGKARWNSDYAQTAENKGKLMPKNYWLNGKAEVLSDGGPDGKGAMLVNHDNSAVFSMKVEAGQNYTIVVQAMPGEAPAAK